MKIIIKTLKQVQYNIEMESEQKIIKDLKNEIQKVYGFDSNLIKLLHNGEILEDSKTLQSYNIKDGNVIIMINIKIKEKANVSNPSSQISPSNKKNEEVKPKEQKISQNQQNQNLGSYNNSNLNPELVKNASIIKILCHNNPNKIFSILNNLKLKSPNLLNKIMQHEQEFKNLLISPINQQDITAFRNFQQRRRESNKKIKLTKEESEAVKRLKELGNFSHAEVIQAFIACDKNEEMTANFLFEQKLKDEEASNKNKNNNNNNQG